jgi:hypothetical protein
MTSCRLVGAILLATISSAIPGCAGASPPALPSTRTSDDAVVVIEELTPTVEALTSPRVGLLYRISFRAHETGGKTGATLTASRIALSNGKTVDGNFTGPGVLKVPRVPANGTIELESTLTLAFENTVTVPTTAAAPLRVVFTVTYRDDNGKTGSATASAAISPKP